VSAGSARTASAFGRRLRKAREALNLSRKGLADCVGCKRESISQWEHGVHLPSHAYRELLSQAVGVSVVFLLTGRQPTTSEDAYHFAALLTARNVDDLLRAAQTQTWKRGVVHAIRNSSRNLPKLTHNAASASIGVNDQGELTHFGTMPLSERIGGIHDGAQLLELLAEFRLTPQTIDEFEAAILQLPEPKKETFARLLSVVIDMTWHSDQIRSASIASAIIHRMAWSCRDYLPNARLERRIENSLNHLPAKRLSIVKPLCYLCADGKNEGAFIKNLERLIGDAQWRAYDHAVALNFYGGLHATAGQILKHGRERPLDRRCQDVGRVIAIYPLLVRDARLDLAAILKENTLQSIATVDVKNVLRGKVADLIHARSYF
jgi:transcriptional regulator with XRE-family HTH domain